MDDPRLKASEVLYVVDGDVKRCDRCVFWVSQANRCAVLGPNLPVLAHQVCGLYVPGKSMTEASTVYYAALDPRVVGLGPGDTACGNCRYGGTAVCLHPALNGFPIDNKGGCCNAWDYPDEPQRLKAEVAAVERLFGDAPIAPLGMGGPMAEAEFDPAEHPRDEEGQFARKGGGATGGRQTKAPQSAMRAAGIPRNDDDITPEVRERLLGKLSPVAWTEQGAEGNFQKKLRDMWNRGELDFYHEAPGDVAASMKKDGIKSDYGVFSSIRDPSDFVAAPVKTVVRFRLPLSQLKNISPDMEYHWSNKLSPHQMLLLAHPDLKGAYVSYPEDVDPRYIKDVKVLRKQESAREAEFEPAEHPRDKSGRFVSVGEKLDAGRENWKVRDPVANSHPEFFSTLSVHPYDAERKFGVAGKIAVEYAEKDLRPTGEVASALDTVIEKSQPTSMALTSWRGMVLPPAEIEKLKPGAEINLSNPSSFTDQRRVATQFAKEGGYRWAAGGVPLLMRVYIPEGTKIARLNASRGVGYEHVLHSGSTIDISKVRREGAMTIVEGVLR